MFIFILKDDEENKRFVTGIEKNKIKLQSKIRKLLCKLLIQFVYESIF